MNIEQLTLYVKQEIDIIEYATTYLGYEQKNATTFSCPACGSKDNVKYKKGENFLKCFGCDTSGNIIDLTIKLKNLSFIEALKDIADNLHIQHNLKEDETTVETIEQMIKRKEEFAKMQKERERKKKEAEQKQKLEQEKSAKEMARLAPIFAQELQTNFLAYDYQLKQIFPLFNELDDDFKLIYLGWDTTHNTPVIINRDHNNNVFNIKYKHKYIYDKEKKSYTNQKKEGKWISTYASVTRVFPLDYFKMLSKNDDRVIICEGEKDVVNLISLGVNALTLGGVTTSWDKYKDILKDKIVYIWFDNDNAGYSQAIKRYKEIESVTKNVFVVLFFQIQHNLPEKYDISDFIIDKKLTSKDDIFHHITYASHKLNTNILKEIEDHTTLNLEEYYFNQQTKTFQDIKRMWLAKDINGNPIHIISPRGEKDIKGLDNFLQRFKQEKRYKNFNTIVKDAVVENLIDVDEHNKEEKALELAKIMRNMISNYEIFYKDYRQVHIADMVLAFEAMTKKTNHTLAKFGDRLAIWTGNYYYILDNMIDNLDQFILRFWMPLAKIDKKKQTSDNVKKILENLHMKAKSLDELKHYTQKGKRYINLINGTLIINKNGKIIFKNMHDKNDGCTNILDFEYDPDATCPKWEKFLNRVIPNKDDQATLMEFIGYCFLPSHKFEAFLYLYGKSGANGKSVIMDVIRNFFGKENISSLNIQDLEGHKLTNLTNKLINIGSEVDTKGLVKGQMSILKALTSTNDDISIDPKHTAGFTLTSENQPKMAYSGNSELSPDSIDGGILRRVLQISFDEEIKDDEKVRDLSERFTSEMSGILNLALKYLNNLIKNGKFTKSDKLLETIENYKDSANPIRKYIEDNLIRDDEVIVPKELIYNHYKEYANDKGNHPLSSAKFFKKLKEEMPHIEDIGQQRISVPYIRNQRPRFIKGVYCTSNDVFSFTYENQSINTSSINYSKKTKSIVIRNEDIEVYNE